MDLIDRYISYVRDVRRYSERTVSTYADVLRSFAGFVAGRSGAAGGAEPVSVCDRALLDALNPSEIRSYEVYMLDTKGVKPKTVNLHLSVLSGFCNYLVRQDLLKHNPVRLVSRPKVEKRLPEFYRQGTSRTPRDMLRRNILMRSVSLRIRIMARKYMSVVLPG